MTRLASRWASRTAPWLIAVVAVSASCSGGSDEEEPSFEELIAELEGREVTQGELARRQEVADFLCGLDPALLRAVWDDLDRRQLEFQDVVFRVECPHRLDEYAEATGRFRIRPSR